VLVRHGVDEKLTRGRNTTEQVYGEMILQVCRDYAGLPDIRTLKASEIRFFYDGLRAELKAGTKNVS